jgi:hypothetical protein
MTSRLDAATIAAISAAAPNVHNGTHTVSHADRGHFTIKLWTAQKGALEGKRLLSLLTGPNNEADYKAVAFWDDANKRANIWRKYKGLDSTTPIDGYGWQREGWSMYEQKLAIWCDLAVRGSTPERHGYWYEEGYTLLVEGRCCVCNRKLTHPESIAAGIGPECAKRS